MKRILVLIVAVFIGSNIFCEQRYALQTPRHDLSGISIYNNFILGLQSGVVKKTSIDMGGLYEILDTTQETVYFNHTDGKLFLSYRSRLPVVFWNWPPPDYYDSDRYYYKLGNEWFYDRFGYYDEKVQAQYLRFPDELLIGCDVVEDSVMQTKDGYDIRLVTKSKDATVQSEIMMESDLNMLIHRVDINTHSIYDANSQGKRYEIRYRRVNQEVPVTKPKGLVTRT